MKTQRTILSPSEFAWFQLGMRDLYDWQIEALEAVGVKVGRTPSQTAVLAREMLTAS